MTHFLDMLADRATLYPDRPAITIVRANGSFGPAYTLRELDEAARRVSTVLREAARPGDRALLMLPTSLDYVAAFLGCLHAGVVAVPAYAPHTRRADERIDGMLRDATPTVIVSTTALEAKLRGSPAAAAWPSEVTWIAADACASAPPTTEAQLHADERGLAFLQYTSGSTREPRGVRVTHANILHNTNAIAARIEGEIGEGIASWVPLFHDMGLVGVLSAITGGGHMHLMSPTDFTARPALWLETITRSRAVMTFGPNFAYGLCASRIADEVVRTLDLSSLRYALTGAEPVRLETIDAFSERFAPAGFRREAFFPAYGMAECTLMVSGGGAPRPHRVTLDDRPYIGCGAIADGLDVRIVDGEVWVSGPSVADGYWNRPAESEETFGARLAGEERRYLRTGDLGAIVDGQLVITGRAKDLIILRGANVHPHDVEAAVAGCHPALTGGVAAVGAMIGDEERLVIVAEVGRQAAASGIDGDAVLAEVRSAVGAAVNAEVGALALVRPLSIPRTSSGKTRRRACRDAWTAGELPTLWEWSIEDVRTTTASEERELDVDVITVIREEIARELRIARPESVDVDRPLGELGLDSLGLVSVRGAVEARLERTISIDSIGDNPTIRELAARLQGAARPEAPRAQCADAAPVDVDLSIMFFSAEAGDADDTRAAYEFVLDACRTADRAGLTSVWIPERHFHRFGGLFPNPSVMAAAIAAVTRNVRIRAGSVVLPLHDPLRVREEWAVVDQMSGGRVDLAFASGWDANSYALRPELYAARKRAVLDGVDEFQRLWRGEAARRRNGHDQEVEITPLPVPQQRMPGLWLTVAQDPAMFAEAGRRGFNVLTALLFQSADDLAKNIRVYREARRQAGLVPEDGHVTLMLHTFLGDDEQHVKRTVREPLKRYLDTSVDLWKQESRDLASLTPREREDVVELAFERYYRESGLFGSPDRARGTLRRMHDAGVDEIACLIDFGVPAAEVLRSVRTLGSLAGAGRHDKPEASVARTQPDAATAALSRQVPRSKTRDVFAGPTAYPLFEQIRDAGLMSFYQEFGERRGPYIRQGDRWLLQLGSLDYLGLSIDPRVREAAANAARAEGTSRTGSRLHNGSTAEQRAFERRIAEFVGKEDGLVFATGYQAQIGLISGLADPDTTVVLDEHAHASLYDGALIARCRIARFKHNDVEDLDRLLSRLPLDAAALVVSEGMYSNEGDLAPLREIVAACAAHGVRLALDEAHALGVLGATGRGSEEEFDIPGGVDILAGTFSKSLASIGGWVAGPAKVIDWIRFHGRSILFSAAISPAALAAASTALDVLAAEPWRVAKVRELARRWRDALAARGLEIGHPRGPVVPVFLGDDLRCLRVSRELMERGIYVNTVVPPSVAPGKALLRTCVTAAHEWEQLESAADVIAEVVNAGASVERGAERETTRA